MQNTKSNISKELITVLGVGIVSGIIITIIVLYGLSISNKVDPIDLGPITIASLSYENNSQIPIISDSFSLPYTGVEALEAGLEDPILCSFGRGKYFLSDSFYANSEYLLLYNYSNQLTGIYFYTSNSMPNPWLKLDELRGGGGTLVVDKEHHGLFVFFRDPNESCKGSGKSAPESGTYHRGTRSTPTPYIEPTATPLPSDLLTNAATQLGTASSLEVTVTTDPENIAVASEADISANVSGLSEIISNLTDVGYTSNTWIDNVSYKGFSGSYTVKKLDALVPGAVDGNVIKVSAWVSEEGVLRRVRLEGALTSDDSASAIRTFDISK